MIPFFLRYSHSHETIPTTNFTLSLEYRKTLSSGFSGGFIGQYHFVIINGG